MNIMDALWTFKRFRRPKWIDWVSREEVENFAFSVEDLQAQDYYVELRKVEITEEQFDEITKRIGGLRSGNCWVRADVLKKELGL
jgi:hypothetical protein